MFFPIDFSRAEMKWVLDLITRVANEGHMDALALVDTFGVLAPHAMQYLVREAKKRINKRLEAHFHMDFGMGVANTIMALAEGVEVVHSTVLGLGERAGNVPHGRNCDGAADALWHRHRHQVRQALQAGASWCRSFPATRLRRTGPVVGDALFQIESGIIASWWQNCGDQYTTELFPFRPEVVGQAAPKVVFGKGSGIDSIKNALQKMGVQASEEEAMKVVMAVKEFSLKHKRLLTEDEFKSVVDKTLPKVGAKS